MMRGMDTRGQVSVEYLLVVLILILVLSIVTVPLISKSIDASNGVSDSSDAKVAVDTLANAADVVYANGPGAKRTVSFYVPQNSTINITSISSGNGTNNYIIMPVTFINGSSNSTVPINASTQYTLTPNLINVSATWHTATVYWPTNGSNITITIT